MLLKVFGSEMVQYFETETGYTVIKNENGFFEYAILDNSGNLITSGVRAEGSLPTSMKSLQTHLRYSSNQLNIKLQRM